MLTHIYIKNFAIIKEIDIDLNDGLNIISGETGTGKSIIIQAVNMALGGRANASLVADGHEKAVVQLVFSFENDEFEHIGRLEGYERFFHSDSPESSDISDNSDTENGKCELVISREINHKGKSLARINGEIVTLAYLNGLTSYLVDIHGQYDNQTFLDPEKHMEILDNFGGQKLLSIKRSVSELYSDYRKKRAELVKLRSNHAEFLRQQDFLRFELNEINSAQLLPGEDEELADRLKILQNSEKIASALNESYEILSASGIDRCRSLLENIAEYGSEYASISSSVSDSVYALDDACEEIRRARDAISFAPDEIDEVINRLNTLDNLKRKYGGSIESVLDYKEKCAAELENFENIDDAEKSLTQNMAMLRRQILEMSEKLSETRRRAASILSKAMTQELSELNFANAQFAVNVSPNVNTDGQPVISAEGTDSIEFLFNANKGGSLKPLSSVASGGEISRIALAFKHITMSEKSLPALVFDEIDTGISGITASVVGRKLHEIAESNQVLCITHLPQIAACGDHQYLISKDDSDERSYTTIKFLSEEERIHEIARLLGGTNITETTLASARELLGFSH